MNRRNPSDAQHGLATEAVATFVTDEVSQIFSTWLNLVTENRVTGKRTHDIRLIAVMLESGIIHVLTLNPQDFSDVAGITVVHPKSI